MEWLVHPYRPYNVYIHTYIYYKNRLQGCTIRRESTKEKEMLIFSRDKNDDNDENEGVIIPWWGRGGGGEPGK